MMLSIFSDTDHLVPFICYVSVVDDGTDLSFYAPKHLQVKIKPFKFVVHIIIGRHVRVGAIG